MMRLTILIATLMVVTAVDHALTIKSVQSVNATLEILVSATLGHSNYLHNKYFANVIAKLEPCFNLIDTRSKDQFLSDFVISQSIENTLFWLIHLF